MSQKCIPFLIILLLGGVLSSCEKDTLQSSGRVELFLVDDYATIGNSFQINEATIRTQASPLVSYEDFIAYHVDEHAFEISEEAVAVIKNRGETIHKKPFAVKANGEIIYSGYFWFGYSSSSCDWVVVDPLLIGFENKINVRLGYPGLVEGWVIPDKRNDRRILQVFRGDNKLIE